MSHLPRFLVLCLGLQVVASAAVAATSVHAVFRSTDRGRTWTRSDAGLRGVPRINALAAARSRHFAGTDGGGIVASTDDVGTWERVDDGRQALRVRSLTQMGGALYGGLDSGGVLRSSNGVKHWVSVSDGLPAGAQMFELASVGGTVFAGLSGVSQDSSFVTTWPETSVKRKSRP